MPRIKNCKITKEKFSIPKSFKLEDHIDIQMGAWGHFGQKYKVEIEFTQSLKTYVMERTWHKGQKYELIKTARSIFLLKRISLRRPAHGSCRLQEMRRF